MHEFYSCLYALYFAVTASELPSIFELVQGILEIMLKTKLALQVINRLIRRLDKLWASEKLEILVE